MKRRNSSLEFEVPFSLYNVNDQSQEFSRSSDSKCVRLSLYGLAHTDEQITARYIQVKVNAARSPCHVQGGPLKLSFTDVSRTITFPDRHFLDKTFPGQDLSQTRRFPHKTFPGQSLSRTDVSRTSYTKEFSCT